MWGLSHYDCALGTAFLTLWYGKKTKKEKRKKESSFFCFKYLEDTPKGEGEKALNKRINKIAFGHFIFFFFCVDLDFLRVVLLCYKKTDFFFVFSPQSADKFVIVSGPMALKFGYKRLEPT